MGTAPGVAGGTRRAEEIEATRESRTRRATQGKSGTGGENAVPRGTQDSARKIGTVAVTGQRRTAALPSGVAGGTRRAGEIEATRESADKKTDMATCPFFFVLLVVDPAGFEPTTIRL